MSTPTPPKDYVESEYRGVTGGARLTLEDASVHTAPSWRSLWLVPIGFIAAYAIYRWLVG